MGWGSGIWKKPIPDPRVKKAPDPGSATLVIYSKFKGSSFSEHEKHILTKIVLYQIWYLYEHFDT
jgi:hypothetical protein